MQIILANACMNVQLNFLLSQRSAARNVRGGGKFYSIFLCALFRNTAVKEVLKSVHICHSYPQNKACTFLWPMVYNITAFIRIITSANGSSREVNDPLCVFYVLCFFCLFGIAFLSRRSADCHQTRAMAHT